MRVTHGYALGAAEAREFAKSIWRPAQAEAAADARRAVAPRPQPAVRRAGARPRAEAARAGEGGVLRARPSRGAASIRSSRARSSYRDPLVEGARLIGLPAGARAGIRRRRSRIGPPALFPGETTAETRLRVAACALSDMAWRDAPELRAEETFRRVLQFPFIGVDHPDRVFLAAALHFRYDYKTDAPWLEPAIRLIGEGARARARGSSARRCGSPTASPATSQAVLAGARLKTEGDRLVLEVAPAARAPDSEVVAERLKWLAGAMGLRGPAVEERGQGEFPARTLHGAVRHRGWAACSVTHTMNNDLRREA